jgi:hypothetical protein
MLCSQMTRNLFGTTILIKIKDLNIITEKDYLINYSNSLKDYSD